MKVLITGIDGFIGKNLRVHLTQCTDITLVPWTRNDPPHTLSDRLREVNWVIHLAGVNRSDDDTQFTAGNRDLTAQLTQAMTQLEKKIPLIYTSSIQATADNPYGASKKAAEEVVQQYAQSGAPVYIFRLPNVFGKWCCPNYNSVVATFCYNIARGLAIDIHDADTPLHLVHVDTVVYQLIAILKGAIPRQMWCHVQPVYQSTVGALANEIKAIADSRRSLVLPPTDGGFARALYSTYLSYLPPSDFTYALTAHTDERGQFAEIMKFQHNGQISFFTAHPGMTRGGHYHHTKTEKFLVIQGEALFRFRNIMTDEYYEVSSSAQTLQVVETAPGWAHDVTNIGVQELRVILWANEIFDHQAPDTYPIRVQQVGS